MKNIEDAYYNSMIVSAFKNSGSEWISYYDVMTELSMVWKQRRVMFDAG